MSEHPADHADPGAVTISRNDERSRWEAHLDGDLVGFAEYVREGRRIVFTHTEVDDAVEGRGVGSALARTALDDVRAQEGLEVVPRCPFIHDWIEQHPDCDDLVAPGST